MNKTSRREFVEQIAAASGAMVLVPWVTSCGSSGSQMDGPQLEGASEFEDMVDPPLAMPADWDPLYFNRNRGNLGAIPESYLRDINSDDGDTQHLGKHLPYVPPQNAPVPPGYMAVMWGDPSRGNARHPNAPRNESNNFEGHWYNWIRVRKATEDQAEELESNYSDWPGIDEEDRSGYAVFGGGELTGDDGRNTIYLAALPTDVQPGDWIRVWAHCLTHGEYVDFLQVPEPQPAMATPTTTPATTATAVGAPDATATDTPEPAPKKKKKRRKRKKRRRRRKR